ncbi:MAG: class I SAM-dependent methyltransferase, partial [Chloroflexota bacterium]
SGEERRRVTTPRDPLLSRREREVGPTAVSTERGATLGPSMDDETQPLGRDDFDRFARHYDDEHASYTDDLPMWEGFAYRSSEAPILELACGTGRVLFSVARLGLDITGIDLSPAMLDITRAKAAASKLSGRVTVEEGDMRAFSLGRQFGMAFIALNSLMHLESRAEQRRAFASVRRHLTAGGRFIIDVFNPEEALPDPSQESQLLLHCLKQRPDGSQLLHFQSVSVNRGAQLVSVTNYYDDTGADGTVRRHLAPFRLRYIHVGELELMLEHEGFVVEDVYGSYDLEPFRTGSPRIVAVARAR